MKPNTPSMYYVCTYIRKDVLEKVAWNVYVILYTIAKIKGFGSKNVRLV